MGAADVAFDDEAAALVLLLDFFSELEVKK